MDEKELVSTDISYEHLIETYEDVKTRKRSYVMLNKDGSGATGYKHLINAIRVSGGKEPFPDAPPEAEEVSSDLNDF